MRVFGVLATVAMCAAVEWWLRRRRRQLRASLPSEWFKPAPPSWHVVIVCSQCKEELAWDSHSLIPPGSSPDWWCSSCLGFVDVFVLEVA